MHHCNALCSQLNWTWPALEWSPQAPLNISTALNNWKIENIIVQFVQPMEIQMFCIHNNANSPWNFSKAFNIAQSKTSFHHDKKAEGRQKHIETTRYNWRVCKKYLIKSLVLQSTWLLHLAAVSPIRQMSFLALGHSKASNDYSWFCSLTVKWWWLCFFKLSFEEANVEEKR